MHDAAHDPAAEIVRLKAEYLMPCAFHFYQRPPVFAAAEDCELIDTAGRRYLDLFSGVTVVNAGHCNREIGAAVAAQAQRLDHTTSIYLTEPVVRLAQRLASITPPGLKRSFFCVSGAEANEGALLLASRYTGRADFISLQNSLHGRTKAAMGVTGLPMWRCDPAPLGGCYRVPHGATPGAIDRLRTTLETVGPQRIAAIIAEPVLGNGGIEIADAGYWSDVRELCRKHGILLIFDEIQTGMNRTGRWWAAQTFGVTPDILTTAKALGNGYPIAAFVTTDAIAAVFNQPYASTFGGNPVGAAAALATIDFHERNDLGLRSRQAGVRLLSGLRDLAARHTWLTRPRGIGLMIAADVVDADGAASGPRLDALLEALKDRNVLCGKTGPARNALTLMPPLTIRDAQIDRALSTLDEVCLELS
ncbi:MAG: aspartate aminotransferase family protein [Phycisphaerales bacterium]|nr:aspartate aminotransferase family protein [Phycisphaerales bacterium]